MRTIKTPKGEVQLFPIERDLFIRIRQQLPYGIVGMQKQGCTEIEYGIVMQCDDEEVFGIKLQPVDGDEEQAHHLMQANSILITHALPIYLQNGFDGVMLPMPYLRDKGGCFESGIAMFIFPDPAGKEAQMDIPLSGAFDNRFGKGCSVMLTSFIDALKQSARETGISLYSVIGMEPRPRMQLGSLSFGYLATGNTLVAVKTTISDRDFSWTLLHDAGITRIQHMPSRPAGITKDDLRISKPEQHV
ncbi:MAG: hypothetical protein OEL57_03030 [Trichlorobacter sp.]|uniref:hypothetical protein n=1 Tax=Trichlorobacter sp. TaxID=2911007 RepID=UPI002562F628|nr:hypothetical protein [Trichlorobacter sp.]MDK9716864.1 hypothetical protein [Trichlorobacter sp.]